MTTKFNKIAIVGMACRFPGDANSLEAYWNILKSGKDVVTEVPAERWGKNFYQHPNKKEPGKSYTFAAGVISDIDQFDADFFGISPREAEHMDPQQRLLLELTWEALENAGQVPAQLAGENCAVYIGIAGTDYAQCRIDDPSSIDAYTMTGGTLSIASNRISYLFDLRGPSVSVDTACSSSLVALHQACQSIWSGESSMAIAGGINMLIHPFGFVGFSKASMLSPTGRCQTFDANGDGYVRAEGAAVLFLKPLAQAEADGDPIHAVIVASGINCDGHTHGMTVPSPEQQGYLLNSIYRRAGIDLDKISYIEAHGTGTAIGDPLETRALGEVIGKARRADNPLPIGSVKTNVGHLETASGMAGLLKTVLCLKHRALPASLHVKTLNPRIDFTGLNLKVVTQFTPLVTTDDQPLWMGVNSFGFGGANAHVLLESYTPKTTPKCIPPQTANKTITTTWPPLYLSAATSTALLAQAKQYAAWLATQPPEAYPDIAWNLFQRRQALAHGLVVYGYDTVDKISAALQVFADTEEAPPGIAKAQRLLTENHSTTPALRPVLVFSGNGSQWAGMGANLFATNRIFRDAVTQVARLLAEHTDYPLLTAFTTHAAETALALTEVAQPVLFAFQVGVVSVLQDAGIQASAVVGHSVGEVAAAWACGALSLAQAVRVIYERSRAQSTTQFSGRMAAVALSAEAATALLHELDLTAAVEIAGINSPQAVTLSGALTGLNRIGETLSARGVFYRLLDLDYAFHSRHMDGLQADVCRTLADLQPNATDHIAFVSTVTGDYLAGTALGAEYWWHNIREPVRFAAAIGQLITHGERVFIEVGPHPILRNYVNECLQVSNTKGVLLNTIRRKDENADYLYKAAFGALLAGCTLDLSRYFSAPRPYVELPTYPWQHERYWLPLTSEGYNLVKRKREHPLLGYRLHETDSGWENQLDTAVLPYLADHIVDGVVVIPAAAYVEMALAASAQWFKQTSHVIENLEIRAPIVLDGETAKTLRFTLLPSDGSFSITSRDRLSDNAWTLNVTGRLLGATFKTQPAPLDLPSLQTATYTSISGAEHYTFTEQVGLTYQAAFQGVTQVWTDGKSALAALQALAQQPESVRQQFAQHHLHPTLLDAGFQTLVDIFHAELQTGSRAALIPIQVGKLHFYAPTSDSAVNNPPRYVHVRIRQQSSRSVVADFALLDEHGQYLAELENCRFRGVQFGRGRQTDIPTYTFTPIPLPLPTTHAAATLPLLSMDDLLANVSDYLQSREPEFQREKHFQHIQPLMDVMVACFAWQAFAELMADYPTGCDLDTLFTAQNIAPHYRPLVEHLLALLEKDGLATALPDNIWQLNPEPDLPAATDIWLAILGDSATYLPELVLLGRCGSQLAALLRGDIAAAELLRPAKSSMAEHWYDSAPTYRAMNQAVREMVQQLVKQWPAQRRLRILEISHANSSLTRLLLPQLPALQCDYWLADLDAVHSAWMAENFDEYAFLHCTNLNRDISGESYQQLLAHGFDLILLNNVLHRLEDIPHSFTRLKNLAVDGGFIIGMEPQAERFDLLTAGLEADWWLPTDTTHTTALPCQLEPAQWQALLRENGFQHVQTYFEPASWLQTGVYLLLAQLPSSATQAVTTPITSANWLIIADHVTDHDDTQYSHALAQQLQHALTQHGQQVCICDTTNAIPTLQQQNFQHIVQLAGLNFVSPAQTASNALIALQDARCMTTLDLVQAADKLTSETRPQLWLITAGAMPIIAAQNQHAFANPAQAPLWGMGRVLMNEHPDLRPVLIDLQTRLAATQAAALLCTEFLHADGEDEILLGADYRYGLRMQQAALLPPATLVTPDVALDFTTPGLLKNLYWRALPAQALQADEIEIKPFATGLNFRDVMYAMGLLSDEAVENGFAGASLGMELAGQVTRVGSDVHDFAVGDAVIGFAPACFSTRVITRTTAVTHKPAAWTYEEAATIPATFFTVYYALHHLAQLEAGEKILIHGASGGVGLAAIQFARYRGAEIFATAGTDEKRAFVQLAGAHHVLDSRSLKFADDILALTNGQGVDVVLNSISGEAINRNLAILKPFGRFLELGKRDFYENSKIGLRPFRNNITYFGIDADQLLVERPALANRLFKEMLGLFQAGVLRPLPYRVFPTSRMVEAFRYMQQSRHMGKVIVSFTEETPQPTYPTATPLTLPANASYLVTGGLSGFGMATARWLVSLGATHLILLSRKGTPAPDATASLQALLEQGIQVKTYACDVTDYDALQAVLADAQQHLPTLRGIIHAAMVLDDGIVRNLTRERFQSVLAPKMLGAWNLHQLTQGMNLDFFVMYSSATTYLGNPGQANYVAANLFLESLAHYRHTLGLPAAYAAWGAIADAGYLTHNQEVKDALQSRLGGNALSSARALSMLGKLMQSQATGRAILEFDWKTIQRVMPAARSSKYREQQRQVANSTNNEHNGDMLALLKGMSAAEAQAVIAASLVEEIAKILRIASDKLATDKSIFDLGMDSLMGMELILAVEEKFGIRLPVMALTEGTTINKIAEKISNQLQNSDGEASNKAEMYRDFIAETAAKHGQTMSNEQIEQLATQMSE